MTPEQLRQDEARRWLAQAGKDLNAARGLIFVEPSRSVFHSQQAAEKAAKGYLALHDVRFRKTHDLGELGDQCAAVDPSLSPLFTAAEDLTDYAVVFRYLDAPREPDEEEAAKALAVASQLVEQITARVGGGKRG
jgi:HEPN domain-containing protein